jgi:glycosyltransferase involved in cell wall biosynthesis
MNKFISVIIPVYNGSAFLRQATRSALSQPEVAEVILIDDGSTDSTYRCMQELAAENTGIQISHFPKNRGAAAARNRGIQLARFAWISFLDADDYFLPGRFAPLVSAVHTNPDADGIYDFIRHQFDVTAGEIDQPANIGEQHLDIQSFHSIPAERLFEALLFKPGFWIPMVGFSVRKAFLDEHNIRFDEQLRYTEDTDFIYRCVLRGNFIGSSAKEALTVRRIHTGNSVFDRPENWHKQRAAFFKKWLFQVLSENWAVPVNRYFIKSYLHHHPLVVPLRNQNLIRLPLKALLFAALLLRYPRLLKKWGMNKTKSSKTY